MGCSASADIPQKESTRDSTETFKSDQVPSTKQSKHAVKQQFNRCQDDHLESKTEKSSLTNKNESKQDRTPGKGKNHGSTTSTLMTHQQKLLDSASNVVEEHLPSKPLTEDQVAVENALEDLKKSLFGQGISAAASRVAESPDMTMRGIDIDSDRSTTFSNSLSCNVAVIDAGTGFCKAGLMGDSIPSIVIPTIIGRQREATTGEVFIGNDAKLRGDMLEYTQPISRGVVTSWDDMEKVYDHVLHMDLNLEPNECGVALPEPPSSTRERREKLTQMMLEKFNVKQLYMGSSSALAMHALGFSTGLVVSVGHGVCHSIPVIQGNSFNDAWRATNIGNEDVIRRMQTLIYEKHKRKIDQDIARAIIEKTCFVDASSQLKKRDSKQQYTLPNGDSIELHEERFLCPEEFFTSNAAKKTVVEMCQESLASISGEKTAIDLRKNIILLGGPSLLPGFGERLKGELSKNGNPVNILTMPKRQYASWRGASMLASLNSSKHRWITKEQYEEHGASIVHRKYL